MLLTPIKAYLIPERTFSPSLTFFCPGSEKSAVTTCINILARIGNKPLFQSLELLFLHDSRNPYAPSS